MRLSIGIRGAIALVLASSLPLCAGSGKDEKKDKAKSGTEQTVDSGAFGVFVKGQRVLTETFNIEQHSGVSIIKAQLRESDGNDVKQKSDLEFSGDGELVRYEWSQNSGGAINVMPKNDFLIEKVSASASAKPAEQPFLMPSTSVILDNNFFVHREILAWRYLAADCKSEGGNLKCQKGPVEFGVLVPQDRTSMRIGIELVGKEKISIRGAEHNLLRLNLTGENMDWSLWLDDADHFKLMRVAIPADDTEVVRD
ncbi:MAG TPA: hypothetical protein VKV39_13410 [Candidatus Sulfotelmatobacter sp.]|nr:hypothetical protein [Candidatus Sulfotelmatobacter sp.]